MRLIPFAAVALLLVMAIGHASVVSLTGSCVSNVLTNTDNGIAFSISNTGNGTATSMQIVPHLGNFGSQTELFSIPTLGPGDIKNYTFHLVNLGAPGSYIGYFLAGYQQGGSSFFATFPCSFVIGHPSYSLITIANASLSGGKIHVRLINIGSSSIVANLSFVRPPSFSMTPQYENVTVTPTSYSDLSFGLTSPDLTNSEYTIGIVASYVLNGTAYSSYRTLEVGQSPSSASASGQTSLSTIVEAGFVALIVVVAILVVIAALRRRGKNHKHAKGESHTQTG
jgi:hypothetical protein